MTLLSRPCSGFSEDVGPLRKLICQQPPHHQSRPHVWRPGRGPRKDGGSLYSSCHPIGWFRPPVLNRVCGHRLHHSPLPTCERSSASEPGRSGLNTAKMWGRAYVLEHASELPTGWRDKGDEGLGGAMLRNKCRAEPGRKILREATEGDVASQLSHLLVTSVSQNTTFLWAPTFSPLRRASLTVYIG